MRSRRTSLWPGNNVWSPVYIDALICRDFDNDANSADLETRHYYQATDLFSVAAITDPSGAVAERYRYTPYGSVTVQNPDGSDKTGQASVLSAFGNTYLFTGRRADRETVWQDGGGGWQQGIMYFRTRLYEASRGCFLNRNPWSYSHIAIQFYDYADLCPTTLVEPFSGPTPPPPNPYDIPPGKYNLPDKPALTEGGKPVQEQLHIGQHKHYVEETGKRQFDHVHRYEVHVKPGENQGINPNTRDLGAREPKSSDYITVGRNINIGSTSIILPTAWSFQYAGTGSLAQGGVAALAVAGGIALGSGAGYLINEYLIDRPPGEESGVPCAATKLPGGRPSAANLTYMSQATSWSCERALAHAEVEAKSVCKGLPGNSCCGTCPSPLACKPSYSHIRFTEERGVGLFACRFTILYTCPCRCIK